MSSYHEERVSLLHSNCENDTESMSEIVIVNWDCYLQSCVDDFLIEQQFKHQNENKFSELSQIRMCHLFPKWYWQKWSNDVLDIFTSNKFIHLMELTANYHNMNMQYYKGSMKLIVDILILFIDVEEIKKQIDISGYNAICKHLLSTNNILNIDHKTKLYATLECALFVLIIILKIYSYHFSNNYIVIAIQNLCCIVNAIIIGYHCYLKLYLMHSQNDLLDFLKNFHEYDLDKKNEKKIKRNKSKCAIFADFTASLSVMCHNIKELQKRRDKYKILQLLFIHMMLSSVVWLLSLSIYLQFVLFIISQLIINILTVSVVINLYKIYKIQYCLCLFMLISPFNMAYVGILCNVGYINEIINNMIWFNYVFVSVSFLILIYFVRRLYVEYKAIKQYSYIEYNIHHYAYARDYNVYSTFFCAQIAIIMCLFIVLIVVHKLYLENIYIGLICLWLYFILCKMISLFLLYPTAYCWDIALHQQYFKSTLWMLLYPIWWNYSSTKYH